MANKTKTIRANKKAKLIAKHNKVKRFSTTTDQKVKDWLTGRGSRSGHGEAIVFEGLAKNDSGLAADAVMTKNGSTIQPKKTKGIHISGEQMNRIFGLTGSNAYPSDLHILALEQKWKRHPHGVGARWGNDVVDNNARRQRDN